MCGIAGYISTTPLSSDLASKYVKSVSDSIFHRGPDGLGSWHQDNVLLIHRRLKIIDLDDRSNQPFMSADGNYQMVFNGEIYNYKELADEHLKGVEFRTTSDTEVLLCLYEKYGEECVNLLNGIFAFCVYDLRQKKIQLFRDHYGVKPLYYAQGNDYFMFCSEIKGLFAMGLEAQLNENCIAEQIYYGYVAGENTIFKGVRRLQSGTMATMSFDGKLQVEAKPYFDLTKNKITNPTSIDEKGVYTGLKEGVQRQMVSDVPVGFMCSGGIDSSAIAALSSQISPNTINTYCARVVDERYDESEYAQIVADHIGSTHKVIDSNPKDIARLLPGLIWAHDEPLKHPNSIPIYQVNKEAKKDVTVMLTGEGSDEIFAGYWVFPIVAKLDIIRRWMPRPVKKLLLTVFKKLGRQAKTIQALLAKTVPDMFISMSTAYDTASLDKLLNGYKLDLSERNRIAKTSYLGANKDVFQGYLYFYQQIHLVSLFDRQDKMSMINALEGRVPFVDVEFVKLVNSIPKKKKVVDKDTKVILKRSMMETLPEAIFTRPKYAFALPVETWVNKSDTFKKMLENVSHGYLVKNNIINKSEYQDMLSSFIAGNRGLGDLIWNILNLDLLARIFIEKEDIIDWKEFVYREEKVGVV